MGWCLMSEFSERRALLSESPHVALAIDPSGSCPRHTVWVFTDETRTANLTDAWRHLGEMVDASRVASGLQPLGDRDV